MKRYIRNDQEALNKAVRTLNGHYQVIDDRENGLLTLESLVRAAFRGIASHREVTRSELKIYLRNMGRLAYLKLRIRIVQSGRVAYKLMQRILTKGIVVWYLAFYRTIGRLPDAREARLLMRIRKSVLRSEVEHGSSTRVWIDKPGTEEKRPLNVPEYTDRIIGTVILSVLGPYRERSMVRVSSGFRMSWCRAKAMIQLMNKLTRDSKLVSVDVRKCFDRINHDDLKSIIKGWKLPKGYSRWALSSLKAEIRDPEKGTVSHASAGTPQGGILSPLLCNEVLHDLDVTYKDRIYDRYADNIVIERDQLDVVRDYLAARGLEIKEEMIEELECGKSIVHLGCELVLGELYQRLTVWYKRIKPVYPPKPKRQFPKIRMVLPKLKMGDSRRSQAGQSGYFFGKGEIALGTRLISPYNGDTWLVPFDSESSEKERRYLAWTGLSDYSSTWYATKTPWTKVNAVTGQGQLSDLDDRLMSMVRDGVPDDERVLKLADHRKGT
jgi:hypothetical protein